MAAYQGSGEGGWKGRKRARELSELKGRLDRASEKEQQSWDLLKQAVENGGRGSGVDEGRFKATGTNRAAHEMRVSADLLHVTRWGGGCGMVCRKVGLPLPAVKWMLSAA